MVLGNIGRPGTPRRGRLNSISSTTKPRVNINSSISKMKVVVRCRPPSEREELSNQRAVIKFIDDQILIFDPKETPQDFFYQGVRQNTREIGKRSNKNLNFVFDNVFSYESTNDDIYNLCTKDLLESIMDGYNCSVFAYGATGAGKTHTMLGNASSPGISYLTMVGLFDKMSELADTRTFDMAITYVEVYNENVHDLLKPSGQLHLREEGKGGVIISGVSIHVIKSAQELFSMLEMGNRNRTQHPTDANAQSSRSHAVFQIHMRMTISASGMQKRMKLSMIDLAGSERASATAGCKNQKEARTKEGANINKSLLALGNCINSLADGHSHIPYRDSKLTRILKDSLGGNCKTVMIANISPSNISYEDTYNTLKYATRAKNIKSNMSANVVQQRKDIAFYVERVKCLEKDNESLKKKLAIFETNLSKQPKPSHSRGAMQVVTKTPPTTEKGKLQQKVINELTKQFNAVKIAQDKILSVQSLMKILQFRSKLKNDISSRLEEIDSEIFDSDDSKNRIMASISQFQGQMSALEKRLSACGKDYSANYSTLRTGIKDMKKNKLHISLADFLQTELLKLNNSAINSQMEHVKKLFCLNRHEVESFSNVFVRSIQLLFHYHKCMKGHDLCSMQMEEEIKTIARQLEQGFKTVSWEGEQQPLADELDLCNLALVPTEDFSLNSTITLRKEGAKSNVPHVSSPKTIENSGAKSDVIEGSESSEKGSNLCSVYDQILENDSTDSESDADAQVLSDSEPTVREQTFVVATKKNVERNLIKPNVLNENKNANYGLGKGSKRTFKSPKPLLRTKKENKENLLQKKISKPSSTMGTSSRFPVPTKPILKNKSAILDAKTPPISKINKQLSRFQHSTPNSSSSSR